MNPFTKRSQPNKWVAPVSSILFLTGLLASFAFAAQARRENILKSLPPDMRPQFGVQNLDLADEVSKLREEVGKLRTDKSALEKTIFEQGGANKEILKSLQETKLLASLTPVKGPGVIITLTDSQKNGDEILIADNGIIHYLDVLKVVNELYNAGAEAVDINSQRLGPGSDVRCVGSVILVDTVKIAPPVAIRAIGDPKTLMGAMNLPGGVFEELRSVDPAMVKIEPAKELLLPAYDGATSRKYAKEVEAAP